MNDEFLNQYRKAPRREFADNLYRRLSHPDREPTMFTRSLSTGNRLAISVTVLCLALSAAMAFSPSARAKFLDVIREVGDLSFTETLDYPGGSDREPVHTFPETKMNLENARQVFSAPIELPAYTPEGYRLLEDQVTVMVSPAQDFEYIQIRWEKQDSSGWHIISLLVKYFPEGREMGSYVVGPGSVEEVSINGNPAALTQGAWSYDEKEWRELSYFVFLTWVKDGMVYDLAGPDAEELIRMAESMP